MYASSSEKTYILNLWISDMDSGYVEFSRLALVDYRDISQMSAPCIVEKTNNNNYISIRFSF